MGIQRHVVTLFSLMLLAAMMGCASTTSPGKGTNFMPTGPADRIGVDLWYAQAPHIDTLIQITEDNIQYTSCVVCGRSEKGPKSL